MNPPGRRQRPKLLPRKRRVAFVLESKRSVGENQDW